MNSAYVQCKGQTINNSNDTIAVDLIPKAIFSCWHVGHVTTNPCCSQLFRGGVEGNESTVFFLMV